MNSRYGPEDWWQLKCDIKKEFYENDNFNIRFIYTSYYPPPL
jgi:hypothetical protein